MKRFLTLLAALIIPLAALAQAQITTKKIKISDFPEKTTKVVLTGNALYDAAPRPWTPASPFCARTWT